MPRSPFPSPLKRLRRRLHHRTPSSLWLCARKPPARNPRRPHRSHRPLRTRLEPSHRLDPISSEPHRSHQLINAAIHAPPPSTIAKNYPAGTLITGPAVILEPLTTTVLDPGWQADVLSGGELSNRSGNRGTLILILLLLLLLFLLLVLLLILLLPLPPRTRSSPSGALQQPPHRDRRLKWASRSNTSMSVNVKERLDFSPAPSSHVRGDLVVNATAYPGPSRAR